MKLFTTFALACLASSAVAAEIEAEAVSDPFRTNLSIFRVLLAVLKRLMAVSGQEASTSTSLTTKYRVPTASNSRIGLRSLRMTKLDSSSISLRRYPLFSKILT